MSWEASMQTLYSVNELIAASENKLSIHTIKDYCRRGELHPCIYFEGNIVCINKERFQDSIDKRDPVAHIETVSWARKFKGYISASNFINYITYTDPNTSDIFFNIEKIIEHIRSINDLPPLQKDEYLKAFPPLIDDDIQEKRWLREVAHFKGNTFQASEIVFHISEVKKILMPAKDTNQIKFLNYSDKSFLTQIFGNQYFSPIEASCLLSGDDPIQMNRCINDTNFDQSFPNFSESYNFINSAIHAGGLPKDWIQADQLKAYLKNNGKIIMGFNDIYFNQSNTFENFDKKSTLKLNISKELDSNYIKIFTVVEFLKKMNSLRYDEVITPIKIMFNNLTLYTLDENLKPVTGYDFCDGACINYLSSFLENADEDIRMLDAAKFSVDEYLWEKNEFFSNKDVISFDLSKKNYNLFLIAFLLNPDDEHIFLNNPDINILQKIINNKDQDLINYMEINLDKLRNNKNKAEQLKIENEKLKDQLLEKEQKIQDIEATKVSSICHPALDPTNANHAPELLLAVEAWEAKYIEGKYPHHEHTPAIKHFLKDKEVKNERLATRISAITNPRK